MLSRASVHHHSVHAEPENLPKTGRAVYPAATKKLLIIKTHKINSGWESESAFFCTQTKNLTPVKFALDEQGTVFKH